MPKLHINVVKPPKRSRLPHWAVGVFAAVVVAILLWGGIHVARRFRLSHTISAPVPVNPQRAKTEPQSPPSPTLAQAPQTQPGATPSAPTVAPPALPARATLRAVRHVSNPKSTAIELDLDRPVEVRAEALHHPERVFLDLSATGIAAEVGSSSVVTTLNISDSRVRRVRLARREAATRVVLDLNCPLRYSYKVSQSPPYQLVVTVEER